jgi:hypothetical protein
VSLQFLAKAAVTIALVLLASVLARRSGWIGALAASLPLTSLLVLAWLYSDPRDPRQVADMAMAIFWFVVGSLPFFVVLALVLRQGWRSGPAVGLAGAAGFAGASLTRLLLARGP